MPTPRATDTVSGLVESCGQRAKLRAGEPIFLQGDRSRSVYVCTEGRVRIVVAAPGGTELLMANRGPGEHFGELAALTDRPRAGSAFAATDSVVAHLPGAQFLTMLADEPDVVRDLLATVTQQLHLTLQRLLARSSEGVVARTGHALADLAQATQRTYAGDARQPDCVRLDISQLELAEWIGASRESVSRALAGFRERHVLETGRGHIDVLDIVALRRLADTTARSMTSSGQ